MQITSVLWMLAAAVAQLSVCTVLTEAAPINGLGGSREPGIGTPVSEWYLSLKTSKGYCGLVQATAAAGGYGFAIACNQKLPQYDSSFSLLLSDDGGRSSSSGGGAIAAAAADGVAAATVAEEADVSKRDSRAKGIRSGGAAGLTDASTPVVVPSGRSVWVLARTAGLCNTPPVAPSPPPPSPPSPVAAPRVGSQIRGLSTPGSALASDELAEPGRQAAAAAVAHRAQESWVRRAARAVHSWLNACRCGIARALCSAKQTVADCGGGGGGGGTGGEDLGGVSSDVGRGCGTGATWCLWWREGCCKRCVKQGCRGIGSSSSDAVGDTQPRAVLCSLGQPSALSFKIFKSDLKDGESVELDKEWIYLMEGDKYCTLADVAGMSTVVSCHLDAPSWSGYKFQLQTLSYPRSQLVSLLTGSSCGVRLPSLPGPHDVECQAGEQAGRAPEVDVVLQTPGSPLAAGVVVGFSTFSSGLMGTEQQRCCAQSAFPHILLCEPPTPGAVPNDCWFQVYDVKIDLQEDLQEQRQQQQGRLQQQQGRLQHGDGSAAGSGATRNAAGVATADPGVAHDVRGRIADAGRSFLMSFLRAMAAEMSPSGFDPELGSQPGPGPDPDPDPDPHPGAGGQPREGVWSAASGARDGRDRSRARQRALLPWIELEPVSAERGAREPRQSRSGSGDVSGDQRGWSLRSADWGPDSRPDPQPDLQLKPLHDGGSISGGGSGGSISGSGGPARAGTGDVGPLGEAQQGGRAAEAKKEPTPQAPTGGRTGMWHWAWVWYAAVARGTAGGGGGNDLVGAAAPLGNGSLVMLMSRSYGRYCSVSLDGTLLCVSAQASNATRNLFTLVMPPVPTAPASAAVEAAVAAAWVAVEEDPGERSDMARIGPGAGLAGADAGGGGEAGGIADGATREVEGDSAWQAGG